MDCIFEAVYENGVLKPLESVKLSEHQRVTITIQLPQVENPDQELESWHQVYSQLSDQEIKEIESIALDRSHFMVQEA
ncbi:MAG: antitoxin family protein [Deltaproteobacteria bacterium]|jgi:predicted DNA-binding antitoxin AbrB/MazE fold protein|nr:antitoxin family protein [Deltaproteobacteria bacterium]